jgi:hypothetical protein
LRRGKSCTSICVHPAYKSSVRTSKNSVLTLATQRQWEETTKGAITKEFFPGVERRLTANLNLSPKTTIMTGHGNIRPYLHRLKIIGIPQCQCKHGT